MLVPEQSKGFGFDPGTDSSNFGNNREHNTRDQVVGYQHFSSFVLVAILVKTGVLGTIQGEF